MFSILLLLLLFAMVTIIIVHIVCNDHLYELFLFFFFAIVTIMVVCIIIYHFSCEIFLSIFLGQQSQFWLHVLLIIVTCIEVFLLVSFLFLFFLVVTITIICIVHYDCLRFLFLLSQLQSHIFLLWLFERDFFFPLLQQL